MPLGLLASRMPGGTVRVVRSAESVCTILNTLLGLAPSRVPITVSCTGRSERLLKTISPLTVVLGGA